MEFTLVESNKETGEPVNADKYIKIEDAIHFYCSISNKENNFSIVVSRPEVPDIELMIKGNK